jgi:2-amino-4-hydroxy-6-hydroxymethyldihydropteridine diphosphokinase
MHNNQPKSAYLSLGSNLGDRKYNLFKAIEKLSPLVNVVEESRVYETKPWGILEQPNFLNQVLKVNTSLAPLELLDYLKAIESDLGRKSAVRYGPREIDIDILLYDDWIIDKENLKIPHQRMIERAFVLVPLSEINPDLVIPGTDFTVNDILETINVDGVHLFQE